MSSDSPACPVRFQIICIRTLCFPSMISGPSRQSANGERARSDDDDDDSDDEIAHGRPSRVNPKKRSRSSPSTAEKGKLLQYI